jgi:hypothetical protein
MTEVEEIMDLLGLPELPEEYDGEGAVELYVAYQNASRDLLVSCTKADAKDYCRDERTAGDGWSVHWTAA